MVIEAFSKSKTKKIMHERERIWEILNLNFKPFIVNTTILKLFMSKLLYMSIIIYRKILLLFLKKY